jgi:CheY-like chemotaxis protein
MVEPSRARVLVVDDDPFVLRSIKLVLAKHDVTALTSARVALDLIMAGDRFDVILCDLAMPEFSGMAFYGELLRVAPEQAERTVFLTGGAFTPATDAFLARVPNTRVDKPFDPAELRALVAARSSRPPA